MGVKVYVGVRTGPRALSQRHNLLLGLVIEGQARLRSLSARAMLGQFRVLRNGRVVGDRKPQKKRFGHFLVLSAFKSS